MPADGALDQAELRAAATSGLMALTGRAGGPPLSPPPGMVGGLDACAAEVARWSAAVGDAVVPDWRDLVTVRAQLLGLRRRGRISANGACRLLRGADGFVAVNLPRPDDRVAVGAIVRGDVGDDPWVALEQFLTPRPVAELVERARLLGVPAAPLDDAARGAPSPWTAHRRWPVAARRALAQLRIVDLSSMWAGPLAARLLAGGGGRVVKVESAARPDGARAVPAFFRALHPADQPVVTLDLGTADGRAQLVRLVAEADVVIESSRPRALEQLGAGPDGVDGPAGKVWLSITGYGRTGAGRDWVAFGDDAAVAGGLVAWEDEDHPVFCGDAVADPVTGIIAAAAALQAMATGGGVLLDVSMQACAASLAPAGPCPSTPAERVGDGWQVVVDGEALAVRDRSDDAQLE
jgi:hypothetical protein